MTPDTGPQALRDAMRRDLTRAMKARRPRRRFCAGTAIAVIDNAEADRYAAFGQQNAATRLHTQARLLSAYCTFPPARPWPQRPPVDHC